jgi:beta-glucosidase
MAIISEIARDMALDSDVDLDASPMEIGSADALSTPDTEVTPPESPVQEHRSHLSSERLWAKKKLSQLTQDEKVRRCCRPPELSHEYH